MSTHVHVTFTVNGENYDKLKQQADEIARALMGSVFTYRMDFDISPHDSQEFMVDGSLMYQEVGLWTATVTLKGVESASRG